MAVIRKWTVEEHETVDLNLHLERRELAKLLPGRSLQGISQQIYKRGLSLAGNRGRGPKKPWTADEDAEILEWYPKIGIAMVLPRRTIASIRFRASVLGVKHDSRTSDGLRFAERGAPTCRRIKLDGYYYWVFNWSGKQGAPERMTSGGPCRLRIPEHRLIAERDGCTNWPGGPLPDGWQVHHMRTDRSDNRPEFLEVWVGSHPSGSRIQDQPAYLQLVQRIISLESRLTTVASC